MKRATLSEVAKAAGVSTAAVAKVMYNSRGNTRVGKEKAEIIRKIAAGMNLAPNPAARALRTGKTCNIGFLSGGSTGEIRVRTMTELTRALEEKGYQIIFCPASRYESVYEYAGKLAASCDALVVDVPFVQGDFPETCAGKTLILTSDERTANSGYPVIGYGHSKGVQDAVRFLYEKGHRKIVMFSIDWWHNRNNARVRAFEKYTMMYGFDYSPIEYIAETVNAVTTEQITALLKKHQCVTAVFCVCDALALKVLQTAHFMGIKVPQQLSVMGFDDIMASELSIPPLTTVRQPNRKVAESAVKYLMNLLENSNYEIDYIPECTLVERNSVDTPNKI